MDYGKLAYLKAQDLEAQIDNIRTQVEMAPYNCLSVLDKRRYYFEQTYQTLNYFITARKNTTITLQYRVLIDSLILSSLNFSVYINDVLVETFTDYIGNETKSFTFTIVADGFPKGENYVYAVIEFPNIGQYNVFGCELNAMGNNIFESIKTIKVDVVKKLGGYFIITGKDEDNHLNIISQNMQGAFISTPAYQLSKNGSEYTISQMYYTSGLNTYTMDFYAYIDSDKNIVINLYNMITNQILDTATIFGAAANKIASCQRYDPAGLALSYISDNKIYTCFVTTNGADISYSAPIILDTKYGRVKDILMFEYDNLINLCFVTDSKSSYLMMQDPEKNNFDFSKNFLEKTINLGKCENLRFKPQSDNILMFIKQNGAVYERVLTDGKLSDMTLTAFCDELIPLDSFFISRKNDRINLIK